MDANNENFRISLEDIAVGKLRYANTDGSADVELEFDAYTSSGNDDSYNGYVLDNTQSLVVQQQSSSQVSVFFNSNFAHPRVEYDNEEHTYINVFDTQTNEWWSRESYGTNTGNPIPQPKENLAYAIFKVEAIGDGPVTLNFDIEQLGRLGIDTSTLGYAPKGVWSENVSDSQSDPSHLLVQPLSSPVVYHIIELEALESLFGHVAPSDVSFADYTSIYIDDYDDGTLYFNDGTAEAPDWVEFWQYADSMATA